MEGNKRKVPPAGEKAAKSKKSKSKAEKAEASGGQTARYATEKLELPGKYYLRLKNIADDTPDCLCKVSKPYTSPQLHSLISEDRLSVRGHKGYRLSRGTHPVVTGKWYFEVTLEANDGHARIGWAQGQADVDLPCGCELWSYSYRDREGTAFNSARGKPYGEPYTTGDVIGCYIDLPEATYKSAQPPAPAPPPQKPKGRTKQKANKAAADPADAPPAVPIEEQVVYWAGTSWYVVPHKEPSQALPHKGSRMRFFKNGADQGLAFENVCEATGGYFPAVSLFKNARATYNFGPTFAHPPAPELEARAVSELGEEDAAKAKQAAEEAAAAAAEAARVAKLQEEADAATAAEAAAAEAAAAEAAVAEAAVAEAAATQAQAEKATAAAEVAAKASAAAAAMPPLVLAVQAAAAPAVPAHPTAPVAAAASWAPAANAASTAVAPAAAPPGGGGAAAAAAAATVLPRGQVEAPRAAPTVDPPAAAAGAAPPPSQQAMAAAFGAQVGVMNQLGMAAQGGPFPGQAPL